MTREHVSSGTRSVLVQIGDGPGGDALLTPKDAAKWLGVSLRTLYTLPIRFVKIGRCRRYSPAELRAYVHLHTQSGTAA